MIEALQDYGLTGIFIGYLIYDRQVIMRRLMKSFDNLAMEVRKK